MVDDACLDEFVWLLDLLIVTGSAVVDASFTTGFSLGDVAVTLVKFLNVKPTGMGVVEMIMLLDFDSKEARGVMVERFFFVDPFDT